MSLPVTDTRYRHIQWKIDVLWSRSTIRYYWARYHVSYHFPWRQLACITFLGECDRYSGCSGVPSNSCRWSFESRQQQQQQQQWRWRWRAVDAALPAGHVGKRPHAWQVMRDDRGPPANGRKCAARDRAVGTARRRRSARRALGRTNRRLVIDTFPARLKSFEFRSTASGDVNNCLSLYGVDFCSWMAGCLQHSIVSCAVCVQVGHENIVVWACHLALGWFTC